MKNTTRLCASKPIVTVNGKFPGPTIYAREDDNVLINVVNKVKYNVSIHWHRIRQLRTGWADGVKLVVWKVEKVGGRAKGVVLEGGEVIVADAVVLALGPWTSKSGSVGDMFRADRGE